MAFIAASSCFFFNVNKVMSDIDQTVKGLLESKWRADINSVNSGRGRNKLHTYRFFKYSFGISYYLKDTHLKHVQCSAMAKMRCGVAPIRIETSQY